MAARSALKFLTRLLEALSLGIAVSIVAVLLGLAALAWAQTASPLPCGPWASYTFHFKPSSAPGVSYRLYEGPVSGVYDVALDFTAAPPDPNGLVSVHIYGRWNPAIGLFFTLAAIDPASGLESAKSNELLVPASTSGICPPPAAPAALQGAP
jgi:hypothetical protein